MSVAARTGRSEAVGSLLGWSMPPLPPVPPPRRRNARMTATTPSTATAATDPMTTDGGRRGAMGSCSARDTVAVAIGVAAISARSDRRRQRECIGRRPELMEAAPAVGARRRIACVASRTREHVDGALCEIRRSARAARPPSPRRPRHHPRSARPPKRTSPRVPKAAAAHGMRGRRCRLPGSPSRRRNRSEGYPRAALEHDCEAAKTRPAVGVIDQTALRWTGENRQTACARRTGRRG